MKLKRDMSTKKSRDFWAGVRKASDEFHKLPEWHKNALLQRWDEIHEGYRNTVPTCHHCGQERKGRCRSCYG